MPIYSYLCSAHGEYDILVREYKVSLTSECPKCGEETKNVITNPSKIDVKLDWNDKAHDMRRDPYTQAKAQLNALDREDQMTQDARPKKWREEQIQECAKQIDQQNRGINKPLPISARSKIAKDKKVKEKD